MIGYLRGRVVDQSEETLVLDVNGVGYEIQCSSHSMEQILRRIENLTPSASAQDSSEVEVWVETIVREDAFQLFGFATKLEKETFLTLLKVNGVGPKMAIKILSGASLERLASLIEAGDVKALSSLPKVGKKTAEQLILTLKGKLVFAADSSGASVLRAKASKSSVAAASEFIGERADVASALVNLGFKLQDVEKVVRALPLDMQVESGIRHALKVLSGQI